MYPQWLYSRRVTHDHGAPDDLLPLPTATFHILVAVADEDRHGYAIIQDIESRTGGELRLSAGTLYRSIQRMLEQGLIVETRDRPAPEVAKDVCAQVVRLLRVRQHGRKKGCSPSIAASEETVK